MLLEVVALVTMTVAAPKAAVCLVHPSRQGTTMNIPNIRSKSVS